MRSCEFGWAFTHRRRANMPVTLKKSHFYTESQLDQMAFINKLFIDYFIITEAKAFDPELVVLTSLLNGF